MTTTYQQGWADGWDAAIAAVKELSRPLPTDAAVALGRERESDRCPDHGYGCAPMQGPLPHNRTYGVRFHDENWEAGRPCGRCGADGSENEDRCRGSWVVLPPCRECGAAIGESCRYPDGGMCEVRVRDMADDAAIEAADDAEARRTGGTFASHYLPRCAGVALPHPGRGGSAPGTPLAGVHVGCDHDPDRTIKPHYGVRLPYESPCPVEGGCPAGTPGMSDDCPCDTAKQHKGGAEHTAPATAAVLAPGTWCQCDWLGPFTPWHEVSPMCRAARPDARRACGATTPNGPCDRSGGHPVGPIFPGFDGHLSRAGQPAATDDGCE